ncbi:acyl--CoA ligase [Nonomuraea sp. NN258]|uniref:class I adenylate-forming enzyme family protein n=1 Tax=Nonomuraea antri TaxID=2730852 RepID=UPI00156838E6|nr:class I adenylate-forming enzyme family protein [Nonomuraea antri]NRQ31530.1 acyl--CoA ligase [Nonomuraea antri]
MTSDGVKGGLGPAVLRGLRSAGSREALVHENRRLSGDQVLAAVSAGVAGLIARGVRSGDPIACLYGTHPESPIARLAALMLGCPFVHLLPAVPVRVAAETMREMGVRVLLHESTMAETAGELLAECPVPVHARLGYETGDLFAAGPAPAIAPVRVGPEVVSSVTFSTGTTSLPKAVAYSHRAESAQLMTAKSVYGRGPWRYLLLPGDHLPNQITLWTLATGGTAILTDDAGPERFVRLANGERVTHAELPTSALYDLADHLAATGVRFDRRLRSLAYGGEAAVPVRLARAAELLAPVLLHCYGSTEAGLITALPAAAHARAALLASVGFRAPGVEVRVCDQDGVPLPAGAAGEVWTRSPQVMTGYVGDSERTAGKLRGGWLRTGDLGRLDADDYLFLLGRLESLS